MELRCDAKLHAKIVEPNVLEVRCNSRYCGHEKGVVVLHRFNLATGELIKTLRFADPANRRRADASGRRISVRSA